MLHQVLPCGVKVKYLDPNDCAISKYARSEPKDREWIRAGIEAGIVSLPTIEYRMRETRFVDDALSAVWLKLRLLRTGFGFRNCAVVTLLSKIVIQNDLNPDI